MKYCAFILARPSDFRMAEMCRLHLTNLGWNALIVADKKEVSEPPDFGILGDYVTRFGMYGNDCAMGIANVLCENSQANDIVMKTDCDVRISEKFSNWLKESTSYRCASYLRKIATLWGGCWAAPQQKIEAAREAMNFLDKCKCPETVLFRQGFRAIGGYDIDQKFLVNEWTGGELSDINTLPICKSHSRALGIEMFNHHATRSPHPTVR